MAGRIVRVQERLGRRILVENVSSYLQFGHSTLREWEFLAELVERADCGLLLDVNNVYVSAHNHGFEAAAFIEGVPAERVGQLHVAGHRREPAVLVDTHDHPVTEAVWDLLRRTAERVGPVSTLLERDDRFPPPRRWSRRPGRPQPSWRPRPASNQHARESDEARRAASALSCLW